MVAHFPHPKRIAVPWCGAPGRQVTTFVDAVDCEACLLLEGFRSRDPVLAAEQEVQARRLMRRLA